MHIQSNLGDTNILLVFGTVVDGNKNFVPQKTVFVPVLMSFYSSIYSNSPFYSGYTGREDQ